MDQSLNKTEPEESSNLAILMDVQLPVSIRSDLVNPFAEPEARGLGAVEESLDTGRLARGRQWGGSALREGLGGG